MRIGITIAACSVLLLGGLAIGRRTQPRSSEPALPVAARVGCVAPNFTLTDTTGRSWRLRELAGQPVLLAFVCGCTDCNRLLKAFANSRGSRTRLLAISAMDPGQTERLIERSGVGAPALFDPFSKTADLYTSRRCPRVWAIDRGQVVRYASNPEQALAAHSIIRHALNAVHAE